VAIDIRSESAAIYFNDQSAAAASAAASHPHPPDTRCRLFSVGNRRPPINFDLRPYNAPNSPVRATGRLGIKLGPPFQRHFLTFPQRH